MATTTHVTRLLLLVTALCIAATSTLLPHASASTVGFSDSIEIPIPTTPSARVLHLCDTDENGNPQECDTVATSGTEEGVLRITWGVAGSAEGTDYILQAPKPIACGGSNGVLFVARSRGGTGELSLRMSYEEGNGVTGSTSEQVIAEQVVPFSSTGGHNGRLVCVL